MKKIVWISAAAAVPFVVGMYLWLGYGDLEGNGRNGREGGGRAENYEVSPGPGQNQTGPGAANTASLRKQAAKDEMQGVAAHFEEVLKAASDDATGRRSPWFPLLEQWSQLAAKAARSGARQDLYALVPLSASFMPKEGKEAQLEEPLYELRYWMEHPGPFIIEELGQQVEESGGVLDAATAEMAVKVFGVPGFDNEPDWEERHKPIDSAGILIARPEIVRVLDQLPVEQLEFFLRAQKPQVYFRRYEPGARDEGLAVLRQRYAAHRNELHAIFARLAGKVAAHNAAQASN